jgi:hypothetical protein
MEFSIQSLTDEHREIEAALDCLADDVASGSIGVEVLSRVYRLCARHYEHEEAFFDLLGGRDSALAAKMRDQHNEALELAARLQEAILAGQREDGIYLGRRLVAIAQHNIIEEERDVFSLAILPSLKA